MLADLASFKRPEDYLQDLSAIDKVFFEPAEEDKFNVHLCPST